MKKTISLLLVLAMIMSLAACGSKEASAEATIEPTAEPFDLEEYKNLSAVYAAEIFDAATALSNIVNFEYKYIKSYKNISGASAEPDMEKVVETGIMGLEEYSDYTEETVRSKHDEILKKYNDTVLPDADNTEANEIATIIQEMHESYVGFYNLAFSPHLDLKSLADSHNEFTNTIATCKAKLDKILS